MLFTPLLFFPGYPATFDHIIGSCTASSRTYTRPVGEPPWSSPVRSGAASPSKKITSPASMRWEWIRCTHQVHFLFCLPAADLYFETPLKIVEYPDPRLRAKNKRINTFDESLKKLADEMFDVMYKTDGIGLSAPQVGMNIQLMVFNPAGERGEGEEIVLVNPVLHKASKKTLPYNEGCLSFPGIYADVVRPASVKIDARDITGARFRVNLSGLPARVFQHEFDHLQGTLFFERMTEDVIDSIRSELKVLEKKYEDLTGQPSPEKIDNYKQRQQFAGFART